jgi:hypothetical protein
MAISKPSLLSLGAQVSLLASQIHHHLQQTGQAQPDFATDSPEPAVDAEYESIRCSLNDVANDLLMLVNGPKLTYRHKLAAHWDLAAYQMAFDFALFQAIPVSGVASVHEIAAAVGLEEDHVARILRFLATERVFYEISPGVFKHTAASALIARDHILRDTFHMQLDEAFRAASDSGTWLRSLAGQPSSVNSPFHHRFGSSIFEYYQTYPDKGIRFGHAMEGITRLDRKIDTLRDDFDWEALGDKTIVDVGGANGNITFTLANAFPKLRFIVQDISEELLVDGEKLASKDSKVANRISFMQFNFFDPQPVNTATAFFIRQCLHDWNDDDVVKILRGFVPALEKCPPRTPLLINEIILPRPEEKSRCEEHQIRQVDISMLVLLGSRQRTARDFEILLKSADKRYYVGILYPWKLQ